MEPENKLTEAEQYENYIAIFKDDPDLLLLATEILRHCGGWCIDAGVQLSMKYVALMLTDAEQYGGKGEWGWEIARLVRERNVTDLIKLADSAVRYSFDTFDTALHVSKEDLDVIPSQAAGIFGLGYMRFYTDGDKFIELVPDKNVASCHPKDADDLLQHVKGMMVIDRAEKEVMAENE